MIISPLVLASIAALLTNPPATRAALAVPVDSVSVTELKALFERLIDAENAHDLSAVKVFLWDSPSTLFVAKTATRAEGNWAGFWGTDVVLRHFGDLYQEPFHIAPDYDRERVVAITADVAEIYCPVKIAVAYAGQAPEPRPFLMILEWVRTEKGWKMATDIALPIPPVPGNSR